MKTSISVAFLFTLLVPSVVSAGELLFEISHSGWNYVNAVNQPLDFGFEVRRPRFPHEEPPFGTDILTPFVRTTATFDETEVDVPASLLEEMEPGLLHPGGKVYIIQLFAPFEWHLSDEPECIPGVVGFCVTEHVPGWQGWDIDRVTHTVNNLGYLEEGGPFNRITASYQQTIKIYGVPEPSTLLLALCGVVSLTRRVRFRGC
jgi:hypothetical protein